MLANFDSGVAVNAYGGGFSPYSWDSVGNGSNASVDSPPYVDSIGFNGTPHSLAFVGFTLLPNGESGFGVLTPLEGGSNLSNLSGLNFYVKSNTSFTLRVSLDYAGLGPNDSSGNQYGYNFPYSGGGWLQVTAPVNSLPNPFRNLESIAWPKYCLMLRPWIGRLLALMIPLLQTPRRFGLTRFA